jgi:hypothetical protein
VLDVGCWTWGVGFTVQSLEFRAEEPEVRGCGLRGLDGTGWGLRVSVVKGSGV